MASRVVRIRVMLPIRVFVDFLRMEDGIRDVVCMDQLYAHLLILDNPPSPSNRVFKGF
jgi:hypothetical protein